MNSQRGKWFRSSINDGTIACMSKEEMRLKALARYEILDTLPEREFDDLTLLAAQICATPIALVTLLDGERQWFKAKVGTDLSSTPRKIAFCDYTIGQQNLLEVPDARKDERFAENPLVQGKPHIQFYAGAPLITPDGYCLGTLCVIDQVPRNLTPEQRTALEALARQVVTQLELRKNLREVESAVVQLARREGELAASEQKYRSLIEAAKDAVIGADMNGRIISWNGGAETIFGFQAKEILGEEVTRIIPARFRQAHLGGMARMQQTGRSTMAGQTVELVGLHKAGHEFPIEISISSWQQGEDLKFTSIIRDITERHQTQEIKNRFSADLAKKVTERTRELEISENRFKELANSMPQIVWTAKPDGILDYYNDRWYDFTGFERDGSGDGSWLPIMPEQDGKRCLEVWYESVRTGEPYDIEYRFWDRKTEQYRWHLGRALAVRDANGNIIKWYGTCTDIHDLKNAQRDAAEATEASQLKSEFLANMSHEIRTPINGVMGMAGLVLDTPLSEEQSDYVQAIQRSAEGLLGIINDILDFSKIEAGRLDFESTDFSLAELLTDTVQTMNYSAKLKGLVLELEADGLKHSVFRGDSGRIRQVLTNLIGNAIKFTKEGRVAIRASSAQLDGTERVRFEIEDSGIGIPAQALNRIFDAFTQADSSMTRRFGGTGLGLSISHKLVDLMGGEIGVRSDQGKGSTFWFELPMIRGEGVPLAERIIKADVPTRPLKGRILVAEDNIINQRVAVKMLEKMGLRTHAVTNGHEALDALRAMPFDLVLMDCQMPELDGYGATRIIRTSESLGAKEIPVIAMTANALVGERELCLAAGMNDYVSKPVNTDLLRQALQKWLPQAKDTEVYALNVKAVDRLLTIGESEGLTLFADLMEIFRKTFPPMVEKMAEAVLKGDSRTLRLEAHSLKSSCATLGAEYMAGICQELEDTEKLVVGGSLETGLVEKLSAGFEITCENLKVELAHRQNSKK